MTVQHWPEECQGYASERYSQISTFDTTTLGTDGFKQKNLYVVSECWTHEIKLSEALGGRSLDHRMIGMITASVDVFTMFILFVAIMVMSLQVLVDYERQRNGQHQTSDFAVMIENLPALSTTYSIEELRIDLWTHAQSCVDGCAWQILELEGSTKSSDIIDIQFIMENDQHYLKDVPKIKHYLDQIKNLDDHIARTRHNHVKKNLEKAKQKYFLDIQSTN